MLVARAFKKSLVVALTSLCKSVGTEYATAVSRDIANHGPFRALNRVPPDPLLYSEPTTFANDWQVYNLLRKYPGLPGSSQRSRQETAARSFIAAEHRCAKTNDWVRSWATGAASPILRSRPAHGAALILEVQRQISRILGPFDRKALLAECRWSTGATATSRRGVLVGKKISSVLAVTPRALPLARYVIARDPHWTRAVLGPRTDVWGPVSLLPCAFTVVPGSRIVPVGKTAYTDRTIAAEPALNSFLQQGFGRWLRRRLRVWGCNLDDQSINQTGASEAFWEGLSTLDLESASDTVASELVRLLLPSRYYEYLSTLRSPYAMIGDRRLKLEKFSSMGNAFTFEVETLIFLATARAVENLNGSRRVCTVYGDDIVVARENAHSTIEALELFGFVINRNKSFVDGPFFESCGKHYFQGVDVTPAYVTRDIADVRDCITVHNKMWRWGARVHGDGFSKEARAFLGAITWPSRSVFKQPPGPLDIAYIDSAYKPDLCPSNGYRIKALEKVSKTLLRHVDVGAYAYKLRSFGQLNASPKGYVALTGPSRTQPTSRRWPEVIWAEYAFPFAGEDDGAT